MEIKVISREMVKPSSQNIYQKKPFKLCIFDQIANPAYMSLIIFYSNTETANTINSDASDIVMRFKKALSITLSLVYPFSGRVKDNTFIDDFEQGVPFVEAQAHCSMNDYLENGRVSESLNKFLPCTPCSKEPESAPLAAFQVTRFACGGIAIGHCFSHKIGDGASDFFFLKLMYSIIRRNIQQEEELEELDPNIFIASSRLPPVTPQPQSLLSELETWFIQGSHVTRRFIISDTALTALKQKAGSRTKAIALSCFIWQRFMVACRVLVNSTGSTPKQSVLVQPVNIRSRTNPPFLNGAIGNLIYPATVVSDPEMDLDLHRLSKLLDDAVKVVDRTFKENVFEGDVGLERFLEGFRQEEKDALIPTDMLLITNWGGFGAQELRLDRYERVAQALWGKAGPSIANTAILLEMNAGKGVDAWLTLDEKIMSVLEKDPEFLAFATPNPKIMITTSQISFPRL